MGLSFGYWFSKRLISSERRLRVAEREQYLQELSQKELKREIAVSKLAFLQTQINPHFLFNVLNFFYSNIYPFSKKLAEAVVLLSDIMRYITKQSSEEGLVPLTDEIEHIEKYIKLNQLRFDNKLQVLFEVTGILEHKKIATFIMMSLIENAFKYGDLLDKNNPLIIRFSVLANRIEFYIENKIKLSGNIPGTGIGLQNLRKRLDLMYADDYDLIITKEGNKFKCQLKINSLL
jgi:LytS/YehU family sensor histidine kinase